MKVKELIQRLEQVSPEAMVVVNGYEGGLEEVTTIGQVRIVLNYHFTGTDDSHIFGPHERDQSEDMEGERTEAVVLPRSGAY